MDDFFLKKISGFITFLAAVIAFFGVIIFWIFAASNNLRPSEFFKGLAIFIPSIIVLLFVNQTKFWRDNLKPKKLKDLETEINIIKKQIEKKELFLKLNSIKKDEVS